MGEDRADADSVSRVKDRLTIVESAALLGLHKNTVRNRVKSGAYQAELVQTERGPTYLIERESLLANLTANTLSSAPQELVSPQAMEFVQELLRPFVSELGEVREALGAERTRRQMAEERAEALEAELEALREPRESPQKVEEAPDREEPHPATGEAQEGTERPQQRSGWLAPVDKLPWWRYLLGILLVFLATFLNTALATSLAYTGLPLRLQFVIVAAEAWSLPGVFGFWVGFRRRNPSLRSEIIPFGALVGLSAALGSLSYELIVTPTLHQYPFILNPVVDAPLFLPGWLLYVSGALIGNAWQRGRTGDISGTIPASPVSGTTPAPAQPREDWTPRKQAILGFSGTIISALITLVGTIITLLEP